MYSKKKKRGTCYFSDLIYDGRRYQKSWGRVSKSIAKELERKWLDKIASGEFQKKMEKINFEKFALEFLAEKKKSCKPTGYDYYLNSMKPLTRFFIGKQLNIKTAEGEDDYSFTKIEGARARITYMNDIDSFMIEGFKKERQKDNVCTTTVNKPLRCLRTMFKYAKRTRGFKENPMENVELLEETPKKVTVLKREEEELFLQAVKNNPVAQHMIAIIPLAASLGFRKTELLSLKKSQIHFDKQGTGYVHLEDTKNGEDRIVPLTQELTTIIKKVIEDNLKSRNLKKRNSEYLFPSPTKANEPMKNVAKSLKTGMAKAGREYFTFHWLRHSFCSRMVEGGVDAPSIMEVGGWKSDSMIKRYAHISLEHKRRAIEKIQSQVPSVTTSPPKIGVDEQYQNVINIK